MSKYKVTVINLERLHTAYVGKSRDKAAEFADAIRASLIIGKGSGQITLHENGVADVIWDVKDGEAFLAVIGGASRRLS
jgi:hypothetical protein